MQGERKNQPSDASAFLDIPLKSFILQNSLLVLPQAFCLASKVPLSVKEYLCDDLSC